jgi:hypothetical protein
MSQTNAETGSLVSGVADIAFIDDTLYAVLAGAGCSHGIPDIPNGVIRVKTDGTWQFVANLSAYQLANPVLHPDPDDFEPDGTWYSMLTVGHDIYAVEPNHQEIVKVATDGKVTRVADISAYAGAGQWIGPTALVAYHGNFYFGNLGTFPQAIGSSNVWKMTPGGQISLVMGGFHMIVGLDFDSKGRMYVLEMAADNPAPAPNAGRITRIDPSGARAVIADGTDGLSFPTALTVGPNGDLFVSNIGFGPPPVGLGQVLRVQIKN